MKLYTKVEASIMDTNFVSTRGVSKANTQICIGKIVCRFSFFYRAFNLSGVTHHLWEWTLGERQVLQRRQMRDVQGIVPWPWKCHWNIGRVVMHVSSSKEVLKEHMEPHEGQGPVYTMVEKSTGHEF